MLIFTFTVLNSATGAGEEAAAGVIGVIFILLLLVIGLIFYFLPSLIALFRNHHQWGAIIVINLFFGWTFVGWVVALAWAVSAAADHTRT